MNSLASVLRELDRDSSPAQEGTIYGDFSVALAQFVHNIVASSVLPDSLQVKNSVKKSFF